MYGRELSGTSASSIQIHLVLLISVDERDTPHSITDARTLYIDVVAYAGTKPDRIGTGDHREGQVIGSLRNRWIH